MSLNNVKVVKKDGTKEEFNVQKVVVQSISLHIVH